MSHDAAAVLVAARRAGSPAPIPDWGPATLAEAWAAQDAVAAAVGPVGGWKVGPGEPRSLAPIMARDIWGAGDTALTAAAEGLALEVEIAFRLSRDLAADEALDDAAALALIGSAHVAAEICAVRLQGGHAAPPFWKLADNLANEGAVIGPAVADWPALDWPALDWSAQTARLHVDGVEIVARRGGHPTGDPVALFCDAVRLIARRGGARAGTPIITGSWTGMSVVSAPAQARVSFDGLGALTFALARR